ncbi:hypothetical protein GJ744_008517 [Endocarpon pusillum]|uniref:Glycoprotease family protein n=1 Tax=Endocarpon pusillum TaxID=364733 RepID=A0A8H7E6S9_9EURO|nr:hypothetical protein GJ744_008517 [Endocarpon pusillum]
MTQDTMSSNVLNSNDNPSKLHIPQPTPKFPLSAISDDQISSRSFESKRRASSVDLASSPHSSQNPFSDTESGNTSGQDEFHLERYSESSALTRNGPANSISGKPSRDGQQGQNALDTKKKRPGLNLVTKFPKINQHALAEHPTVNRVPVRQLKRGEGKSGSTAESQTCVQSLGEEARFANSGFINLNDLEGLRKNKRNMTMPKAGKGPKKCKTNVCKAGQELGDQDTNGLNVEMPSNPALQRLFRKEPARPLRRERGNGPHQLQAPEQEPNGISPTARSVIFGISVPENEVEAHKPSDEASSALTMQTPITPSIVVTPADATVGWTQSAMQSSLRRPVSSIYSQMPGIAYKQDADAPPVPSLPSCHKQAVIPPSEPCRRSVDTWEASSFRSGRRFSSETIIEEDYAQQPRNRPISAGSKDGILPSSCDTGRPRSKGWWNLMLSPMLSRAGTNATKKAISPSEEVPALPCTTTTGGRGLGLNEQTPTDDISPATPRRAGLQSIRNSSWSNWTQWEQDREQAQASQQSSECAGEMDTQTILHGEPDHSRQVAVDGCAKKSGLAAEYYQACAFDLLDPKPYFDCVNHDCANALPKLGGSPKGVVLAKDANDDLGLEAEASMKKHIVGSSSPPEETRLRSDSDSTIIEDDPIELSPNVRKAHARPFLKAAQTQMVNASPNDDLDKKQGTQVAVTAADEAEVPAPKSSTPPAYSPPPAKPIVPRYVGIMPPDRRIMPSSPGPLSPEAHRAINPSGGIPMAQVHQPAPTFVNFNTTYPADLPPRPAAACVSLSDIENPVEVRQKAEARRQRLEQEDAAAHKAGGLWRGRGCVPKRGCYGRGGSAGRTRRRWYIVIVTSLVFMIILIVVLATQLTRKGDQTPVQSQWLNLTGYPPMPTGISTIARPDAASAVTACVQPSSLWSCALPREDQASNAPSNPDQPNFRLEIKFRNGTVNANGTVPVARANDKRAINLPRVAMMKRQKDPFTNSLFEPNPAPPSLAEQEFIGNTTDNITVPFSGEPTPFFLTLLTSDPAVPESFNNTNQSPRRRLRRQGGSGPGGIPAPAVLVDGTAAPANLLPNNPLPFSQPVMLYDRGLASEHYGFYTYFDRSIFIKSSAEFNSSSSSANSRDQDPNHSAGGSSKQDADLRCTWAQTRFLVQIWTNARFGGQLLPSANGTVTSSGPANPRQGGDSNSGKSSATDFSRPGSFPYPVSVTLDRHGGDGAKKGVYCYGMDGQQKIVVDEKKLVPELRDAGGRLINAAPGIFSNSAGDDNGSDPKAGGIDGGTGGCGCEWRNWVENGGQ